MMRNFSFLFLSFLFLSFFVLTPAQAVTVGPAKIDQAADPGDVISGSFFVMNEGDKEALFSSEIEIFFEEGGEKKFYPADPASRDLPFWFDQIEPVVLKAGEQRYVPFTVRVPSDASPGGHYAVVWWKTQPLGGEGSGVGVVTRAGVLMYLRISGDVNEAARLVSITDKDQRFFWSLPVSIAVLFKNDGNVHLKPNGDLFVRNILGKERAHFAINKTNYIVFPGQPHKMIMPWEPRFAFGPYKVALDLAYGKDPTTIQKEMWIFVFPWKISVFVFLVLFVVFFLIPQGIIRYNRWIIEKAQGKTTRSRTKRVSDKN